MIHRTQQTLFIQENDNRQMHWQIKISQHIIHEPKNMKRTENILFLETKNSRNTLKPTPSTPNYHQMCQY